MMMPLIEIKWSLTISGRSLTLKVWARSSGEENYNAKERELMGLVKL